MANSPRKTSSPRKSKPKKVLPIKRYKSITRKTTADKDKPEVHTNQGVSRVPWEPSNAASIAEASPIASRQFNLDFKGWSKSKKDVIGQSSNGNANGGSKLSSEITNEKGSVKTNGNNSKSVKKSKASTKQTNANTQEDVQSNSLLALDEWLTSDQMNIEVSEPTKTTQSNKRLRSKVKFIAKDDNDLQDSLQSPKKPVRLRASPVKNEFMSNGKGDKKTNDSKKENNIDDFGIDDVDIGNENYEEDEEDEEDEVVEPPRNARKDSIQLKKSKPSASSSQAKQPPKKSKPTATATAKPEPSPKPQKRVPIPLQQLTELSTDLLKEKKHTLELEQQLLYLKQEQKSLKPLPPLSEDITNDYSNELNAAQIKLEQINNEVNNLREEKASNLLTLIHNLRSKTDRKINSIQNLSSFALTKLNQSYTLFFRLLTNIEFNVVSVSNLDLVRISNRYENLSIIDKVECKQAGKQGVHNYFLYTVQELNSNIKFIYEPIDPYEADHIPWQYLPEYLRDKLLFDLDQGANFLRVVFKVLNSGGEGKK